jgi:hypothetical protein
VKHWYANIIKPYWGFCPLLPWQAHGGDFANLIVRPRTCYQGQGDSTRKFGFHKQGCIQLTLDQRTYQYKPFTPEKCELSKEPAACKGKWFDSHNNSHRLDVWDTKVEYKRVYKHTRKQMPSCNQQILGLSAIWIAHKGLYVYMISGPTPRLAYRNSEMNPFSLHPTSSLYWYKL